MKIYLLPVLLILYSSTLNSQTNTYHPNPHENAEWSLLFGIESFEPFDTFYYIQKFQSGGDSIVGSKSYIKYMSGTGVFSLFRDDTVSKKVYTFYDDGVILKDTLLYDFNLPVGASVSHSIEFLDYPDALITEIDSIFIDGNYRKRMKINYSTNTYPDSTYWIEGIGSTNGILLGPHDPFEMPSYRKLACYSEFADILHTNLEDWYSCDSVLIDQTPILINQLNIGAIDIYPNPVTDFIIITGNQYLINSITAARLINMSGREVSPIQVVSNKVFFTNQNLSSGIYILVFETSSTVYTFKIIKS